MKKLPPSRHLRECFSYDPEGITPVLTAVVHLGVYGRELVTTIHILPDPPPGAEDVAARLGEVFVTALDVYTDALYLLRADAEGEG